MIPLAAEIGASDCETLGSGFLAQPHNALSSAAYLAAGLALAWRARRAAPGARVAQVVYGLTLAAIGLGSVAFHGPQPVGARFLHDVPIAATLAFIAVHNLGVLRAWPASRALLGYGAAVGVFSAAMALAPAVDVALTAWLVVVAGASEFIVARSGARDGGLPGGYAAVAAVVLAAGALNLLGRSGGPLCDPDGPIQLHALWHVLTAAVLWAWAIIAFPTTQTGDRVDQAIEFRTTT